MTTLHISSILSSKVHSNKTVGVQTPQGKVYCPACAAKRKAEVVETYKQGDSTDWSITCDGCEESILEPSD